MTKQTVAQVAQMQKMPNFVVPVSDYDFGWELFFAGAPLEDCRNAEQAQGYNAAWNHGREMLRAEWMMAEMHDEPAIENDYADIRRGY